VELIRSEQYTWYRRKWPAMSSYIISTWELPWVMGMSAASIANFVVRGFVSFLESHKNIRSIRCSKNWSLILATRRISATSSTQLALMRWNCDWCKLKHARTCLYYDQVAWLPLSHAMKQF
jgi:hypothetical protein